MDIMFYVFAGVIAIAAALATIAIWAPRPAGLRVLAVAITTLFIPVVYVQLIGMLSKPKPMSFEWYERSVKKAIVLGIIATYVWSGEAPAPMSIFTAMSIALRPASAARATVAGSAATPPR